MTIKKSYFLLSLILFIPLFSVTAEEPILCRISVENLPPHFHTQTMERYSTLLAERSKGLLRVEFYHSAGLYRDSDALGALARGQVEIIAPGIWQFDRYVPDTAALMLPSFYAKERVVIRALVDGPFGQALSQSLEKTFSSVVLGPWLDLGYGHLFSMNPPIRSIAEIRGKRVRVAGGRGNEERIRVLGGQPLTIPWSDLPSFLERNLVDGVLTTYETIDSAKLDTKGIKAVLEDSQYYPFYVPMVNGSFWDRLTPQLQSLLKETWLEVVGGARRESERAQDQARENLVKRGLIVYKPTTAQTEETRKKLLLEENAIALRLNVSPLILELLKQEIKEQGLK